MNRKEQIINEVLRNEEKDSPITFKQFRDNSKRKNLHGLFDTTIKSIAEKVYDKTIEEPNNKCDECGTELEKTFVLTEFKIPFICWVCPKSECYQAYKKEKQE